MVDFETVTFGGSGFDRAANLRKDKDALSAAMTDPQSQMILFWRGKPLFVQGDAPTLARLAATDKVGATATEPAILLGRQEDGALVFAQDISAWEPAAQTLPDGSFADQTIQTHPDLPGTMAFMDLRQQMGKLSARDAELSAIGRSLLSWHQSHQFCSACGVKSVMVDAGWQRSCPACNTQHFPRTDPVVIMLVTHGNDVLLGRSPGWPEGMFSLLAGFVEPGETPEAAVRREVLEEVGVPVGKVDYLGSQPWAFPSSLMIGCRAEALGREMTIDPAEIEEALWVSREELMTIYAGAHPRIRPGRKGAIASFILSNWLADRLD
ncbi:NAD(+) diphosphatase [Cognatishimia sp. SS12]|uniref:NAD(+) diphosphatase n=1 Tax=Cognatishimia sp. SS12 TaxID=2979465 RepID=UPI002330CDC1|nr:NAD(+) diphosphatase [Cognatishimia sp. SS12]MDC0739153.1 NAD(+) diphosphatase [Cognatishimia sp. SS12]